VQIGDHNIQVEGGINISTPPHREPSFLRRHLDKYPGMGFLLFLGAIYFINSSDRDILFPLLRLTNIFPSNKG